MSANTFDRRPFPSDHSAKAAPRRRRPLRPASVIDALGRSTPVKRLDIDLERLLANWNSDDAQETE
jgi:hypothetical protein